LQNLALDVDCLSRDDRAAGDSVGQRLSFEQLKDKNESAIVLQHVKHLTDMTYPRQGSRLTPKAFLRLRIVLGLRDGFDGYGRSRRSSHPS
jgi:hypothetical protein